MNTLIFWTRPYNLEILSSSRPSLVVHESVQPLQDCLDFLLSESLLYKFDCVPLSQGHMPERIDSPDHPFLSSLVTSANVASSPTIIT
jgi:hypothetical protein